MIDVNHKFEKFLIMCYTVYVQVIGTAFDNPAQLIPERNGGRFFEFEN